jgi:hypothetical protein
MKRKNKKLKIKKAYSGDFMTAEKLLAVCMSQVEGAAEKYKCFSR